MHRFTTIASLAAAVLGACELRADAGAEPAQSGAMRLEASYNGYFYGLRIMRASLNATVSPGAYETDGAFRTAGFAGWVKDTRVSATGSGARSAEGLAPGVYRHEGFDGSKNRTIDMTYGPRDIDMLVDPPFGDWGDPPASPTQRLEALDPLSAMLAIAVEGGEAPCERTVPVFDSRLRYDLVFEPAGMETVDARGYHGLTHHCVVSYVPVAGFDPSDLEQSADAYETPIHMWLADMGGGLTPPVRFRARYGLIGLRVDVREIRVTAPVE